MLAAAGVATGLRGGTERADQVVDAQEREAEVGAARGERRGIRCGLRQHRVASDVEHRLRREEVAEPPEAGEEAVVKPVRRRGLSGLIQYFQEQ